MRLLPLWVLLALLLFAGQANAELYQYEDAKGVIHYTDDLGNVPEAYRNDVKVRREIQSRPGASDQSGDSVSKQQQSVSDADTAQPAGKKQREGIAQQAKKLEAQHNRLQKEYEQLKAEQEKLKKNRPPKSASKKEKRAYEKKVRELNKRIEAYRQRADAYKQKVDAFNAKVEALNKKQQQ